jgi:GMP synthase (glutamine-hydrolysing)
MKILIIDNNSKHIEEIKNLCLGHAVSILKWSEISTDSYRPFDLIILSGGSGMSIDKHTADFKTEADLIRKSNKPIIGICLGFELICKTFGCRIEREEESERGLIEIQTMKDDQIFGEKSKFKVFMAHKWHVREVDPPLIPLARSEKGIDIVRHLEKQIYGFQFHPEVLDPENDGHLIFNSLIERFRQTI